MKNKPLIILLFVLISSCNTIHQIPLKVELERTKEIKKYSGYNGKKVLDVFSTKGQVIILFIDGTNLEIKKSEL